MSDTIPAPWPASIGSRSRFARYQELVAAPAAWPAASIAPDLEDVAAALGPADLPGVQALTAESSGWCAATIAPDLD